MVRLRVNHRRPLQCLVGGAFLRLVAILREAVRDHLQRHGTGATRRSYES